MSENTDRILATAETRQLSSSEIDRLRACIKALEHQKCQPEDRLLRQIRELENKLKDYRELINKYDLNQYMA